MLRRTRWSMALSVTVALATIAAIIAGAFVAVGAVSRSAPVPGSSRTPAAKPTTSSLGSTPPAPVPVGGFKPSSVAFWDGVHGVLAGQFVPPGSSANCADCLGMIQLTADGGRTWHQVYRGGLPVRDVTLAGPKEIWATFVVVFDNTAARLWELLGTRDGGATWTVIRSWPID